MASWHQRARPTRGLVLWTVLAVVGGTPLAAQDVDYAKAERFLTWNTSQMISGDQVNPQWLEDGSRFWYRNKTGSGYQFVLVDPVRDSQGALFDHYRMAAAMGLAADTTFNPDKLPFSRFEFLRNETAIEFVANRKRFECEVRTYTCTVEKASEDDQVRLGGGGGGFGRFGGAQWKYMESPDERWEAFVHEYNLYIRPSGGGDSIQLTTDGEKYWSYGYGEPRPNQQRQGGRRVEYRRPQLVWSPDSRRIVVTRRDERNVEHMHYISMTPQRPEHFSQPYALPGDSIVPYPGFHVITIETDLATDEVDNGSGPSAAEASASRAAVRVLSNVAPRVDPTPHQLSFGGSGSDSTWTTNSQALHVTYYTRGSKSVHIAEVDPATGQTRRIVADSAKTFVELGQRGPSNWHVTDDGNEVIWWSERDGWAHLYRFGADGTLRNQITSGPWTVGTMHRVDEGRRVIYFTGRGREPGRNIYYQHLYRVNFDGTGLQLLTPEDGDHSIEFSPSGQFFVDTYSKIDEPPVTVLRSTADGRVIRTLERADVSRLVDEIGWKPAQVFSVKARDGLTNLYGLIYFPPGLDSTKQYPIISHIYPGPQIGSVGSWTFKGGGEDFALAQLGFVVIQLDHLGTPFRSKAFHDNYYGNFTDNGLPDHVTAIKQLAARYPFIDLDRVGIYGHSGGGFASTDAMFRFPDFFKVAVSGAGNHDNRSYNIYWAEKYQGELTRDSLTKEDNFESSANKTYAGDLKGKLLLMHGDMDDNVHPAMTIQVVDELIKANKDFDLIWAPNRAHGLNEPYFIRRRWDYFVTHLLGKTPPPEYDIKRPEN